MKRLFIVMMLLFALGCGPQAETEETMLGWGRAFNLHLGTGGVGGDYTFPRKLDDVDESLRLGLSRRDGWDQEFFYRRIRDDRYHLISAGPDGRLGNGDDIVMANSSFYPADEVYARYPLSGR